MVDVAANGLARSTIRNYQGTLKVFLDYLCDRRYPWAEICEQEFGWAARPRFRLGTCPAAQPPVGAINCPYNPPPAFEPPALEAD